MVVLKDLIRPLVPLSSCFRFFGMFVVEVGQFSGYGTLPLFPHSRREMPGPGLCLVLSLELVAQFELKIILYAHLISKDPPPGTSSCLAQYRQHDD